MAFEKELHVYQDSLSKPLCQTYYRRVNPFRGLDFFDSEHAPFFHGRTKTVGELLNVLQQQAAAKRPFVLVLGPDGCGKTSLVRAGILPVFTQTRITEGDRCWRFAITQPGNGGAGDPFDALAAALLEESAVPEFPDAATHNGWKNLAAELREAPENAARRLLDTLQYLSVQALDHFLDAHGISPANPEQSVELPRQNELGPVVPKVRLMLVVDQLEELFVGGFSPELQQRYIAALSVLVEWRAAFVVAMLRSDFYTPFKKCCIREEALRGRFDLRPPSPQELREMIHLSAEATGLRFELDPETGQSLDSALLEAMTVSAKPLPLLEHLLWQLYRKQLSRKDGMLRWSDYHELGKLDGALVNHAESVFSALDENAQAALKSIIRQLVSTGPGEEGVLIRRSVPYHDLVSTPEFSECQKTVADGVIVRFIKERLFHAEKTGPNAEVLVSITQECLLRNWPRVRQLLKENLGLLRVRDRLEANFKLWLSRGRRSRDLLHAGSGISEAETLLRSFRASLSGAQVDYLQKSLKAHRALRWLRNGALLALGAGVVTFLTELVVGQRDALETQLKNAEVEAQHAQRDGELLAGQRDALRAQLKDAEAEARKNMGLLTSQRDALQAQLKDAEAQAQQAQKSGELLASQRDALQTQLKDTEAKARQAQKSRELVASQRDALQDQFKDAEAQARKALELLASQRDALQAHLKDAEESKHNRPKRVASLWPASVDALQDQFKDAEAEAQQNLELLASQRDALQAHLKDAQAQAQQAQKNMELLASQRDALQAQLKDAQAQAQQAQRSGELVASQWDALQASHHPTPARTFRRKASYQSHSSARRLGDAEAKRRLIELWHRSLAKSEAPKRWAIFSRQDKRKKASTAARKN